MPLLLQASERSLNVFVRVLKPYDTATLMVEGPRANLIDAIEAFGLISAHNDVENEVTEDAAADVFDAFRLNFLSPPLVIIATMCPCWTIDESTRGVFKQVAAWMSSAAAKAWCAAFGHPLDTLSSQFKVYAKLPKTIVDNFSREDFQSHLKSLVQHVPVLVKFISHISLFTASEAECERVFSVVKKTVPLDRVSLCIAQCALHTVQRQCRKHCQAPRILAQHGPATAAGDPRR